MFSEPEIEALSKELNDIPSWKTFLNHNMTIQEAKDLIYAESLDKEVVNVQKIRVKPTQKTPGIKEMKEIKQLIEQFGDYLSFKTVYDITIETADRTVQTQTADGALKALKHMKRRILTEIPHGALKALSNGEGSFFKKSFKLLCISVSFLYAARTLFNVQDSLTTLATHFGLMYSSNVSSSPAAAQALGRMYDIMYSLKAVLDLVHPTVKPFFVSMISLCLTFGSHTLSVNALNAPHNTVHSLRGFQFEPTRLWNFFWRWQILNPRYFLAQSFGRRLVPITNMLFQVTTTSVLTTYAAVRATVMAHPTSSVIVVTALTTGATCTVTGRRLCQKLRSVFQNLLTDGYSRVCALVSLIPQDQWKQTVTGFKQFLWFHLRRKCGRRTLQPSNINLGNTLKKLLEAKAQEELNRRKRKRNTTTKNNASKNATPPAKKKAKTINTDNKLSEPTIKKKKAKTAAKTATRTSTRKK